MMMVMMMVVLMVFFMVVVMVMMQINLPELLTVCQIEQIEDIHLAFPGILHYIYIYFCSWKVYYRLNLPTASVIVCF